MINKTRMKTNFKQCEEHVLALFGFFKGSCMFFKLFGGQMDFNLNLFNWDFGHDSSALCKDP